MFVYWSFRECERPSKRRCPVTKPVIVECQCGNCNSVQTPRFWNWDGHPQCHPCKKVFRHDKCRHDKCHHDCWMED